MESRKKEKYKIPVVYIRDKKFLKPPSSKHQIFVKDLLSPYQGVSSKCCVQKGSQQNTDIVNRLTALNNQRLNVNKLPTPTRHFLGNNQKSTSSQQRKR